MLKRMAVSVLALMMTVGIVYAGGPEVGKAAPGFTLTDSEGKTHSLADFQGKYVVLEWINYGCPFVRKHYDSGNMQSLQKQYTEKGVVWLAICSSAEGKQGFYEGEELTEKIAEEKGMQTAYLIDESGEVGKKYDAKTTPHMFVIDPEGKLLYAGGIDDKPSAKQSDIEGATNYVSAALDAAMSGKPVEVTTAKPYGCSVKYK